MKMNCVVLEDDNINSKETNELLKIFENFMHESEFYANLNYLHLSFYQ